MVYKKKNGKLYSIEQVASLIGYLYGYINVFNINFDCVMVKL